jgi:hypothetical protein
MYAKFKAQTFFTFRSLAKITLPTLVGFSLCCEMSKTNVNPPTEPKLNVNEMINNLMNSVSRDAKGQMVVKDYLTDPAIID